MTSTQRRELRQRAHTLEPVVMIGRSGLTEALIKAADEALNAHKLIKVRFQRFKDDRREISARLAGRTASELVGVLGHVAILYRESAPGEAAE